MNSSLIFIFLLFVSSCGVKGPPKALPGTEITPWVHDFIGKTDKNDQEKELPSESNEILQNQ